MPCISYLSAFQTRLVLHTPISDCSASYSYYITISFHHFQNVVESIARSSFRTTGFYLWHNKDAPQSGVWGFLLIGLIFFSRVGGQLYNLGFLYVKLNVFGFPEYVFITFCCNTIMYPLHVGVVDFNKGILEVVRKKMHIVYLFVLVCKRLLLKCNL